MPEAVDVGELFPAPAAFDLEDLARDRTIRIGAPLGQDLRNGRCQGGDADAGHRGSCEDGMHEAARHLIG